MKIIDPQDYLRKLQRKFGLDPIYELDLNLIQEKTNEYDRRAEIAKLFIPDIENAGPYEIRYDLAITMVSMLVPFDKRTNIMDHISDHYNILKFYPWNIESLKDWVYTRENYYHPGLPAVLFSNPAFPPSRIKDFTVLLNALKIFQNIQLSYEQFERIFYYYSWKSVEFELQLFEIDILKSILPYYSRDIEEINIYLENLYSQGSSTDTPKFVKDLVERLGKDYKTVKKYLDELKSQKLLHQVLWFDTHYIGLQSLLFLLPNNIRVKSGYSFRKYNAKSAEKSYTFLAPLISLKIREKMQRYVEMSLKKPVKAYSVYNIPIIHYSFEFYNNQKNKVMIKWDIVYEHFKKCKFQVNEKDYEPARAPRGDIDVLTLKIFEYLSGNANISSTFLQETLKAPLYKINDRKKKLETFGIRFPYIFSNDWSELYFFKADISNIGEINYCIRLLSIFPSVAYNWCQNVQDPKDSFLLSFIHLPTGSYPIFKTFGKHEFPFNYELYYGSIMVYYPSQTRSWELFDEEKNEYHYDFSKFKLSITD